MSIYNKVIWSEGMFLQPQHFQQQDRYHENITKQFSCKLNIFPWGFSELKLDKNMLTLGKIAVTTCSGIFPELTPFNTHDNEMTPKPIDIATGTSDMLVYLTIPLESTYNGLPRYLTSNFDLYCTEYHCKTSKQIDIGKLNLKLMLDNEDRADYSGLAIARIKETCADHQIKLDESFIPACIDIQCSHILNNFLLELISLLKNRAESLASRITITNQEGTAEITDFLLLQLINRHEPYFNHLATLKNIHPAEFYKNLIKLIGELSTFTSIKRRPNTPPYYLHDNLQETFLPIMNELRKSFSTVLEQNAIAIPLQTHQFGIWTASITNKIPIEEVTFVLAVHADMPLKELQERFPLHIKIATAEQIRSLVTRALPGIDLQILAVAPRQIPYHTNYVYFTLNKKHQFWTTLNGTGELALHISGNFPNLKLELWAIKE